MKQMSVLHEIGDYFEPQDLNAHDNRLVNEQMGLTDEDDRRNNQRNKNSNKG